MIHVFCPNIKTEPGTFEVTSIDANHALDIIRHGQWNEFQFCRDVTPEPIVWRHTWASVKYVLRRYMFIPGDVDRRGSGAAGYSLRMDVGDTGVLFAPVGKPDLRSRELDVADFEFYETYRIE